MTEYIAQGISRINGNVYYVNVTGRNKSTTMEKLFDQYKNFNFNIFTKAEFFRYIYEEKFVFEKYDEDGGINEYQYVEWDLLPTGAKKYYRNEAMRYVITLNELKRRT
ncbi:MAG: hypothetical protein KAS04_00690 [Candidatus Aenigmarchaeota archaeon]|nr:hypothetical protein [Candidatus Aenigmarchaeota archaeon]